MKIYLLTAEPRTFDCSGLRYKEVKSIQSVCLKTNRAMVGIEDKYLLVDISDLYFVDKGCQIFKTVTKLTNKKKGMKKLMKIGG